MEENRHEERPHDLSYFTFEAVMAREERHVRRLIIALVIAIIGIVISNAAWLFAWMQYDYSDNGTEISVDGGQSGNTAYIGERGFVINGQDYGSEMDKITDTENIFRE